MNSALITTFVHDQKRLNYQPRSIERRRDMLRSLAAFHDDRYLLDLTTAEIEAWVNGVPRGPRTRYNLISTVSSFLDWAVAREHTTENPARRIDRPRLHRTLPRPIPHDDLALAVHHANPMVRCWLLLAALGGLRCQEIAGMHRSHIWDHEVPGILFVAEAKGGQERTVPLHTAVLDAVRAADLPRTGPMFRNAVGRPYSPARVSQLGNAYLKSVGVGATMHQLRHRFGTDVYALCEDLRVTQELLGHQSPNSTAIYTLISKARAAEVVNRLVVPAHEAA